MKKLTIIFLAFMAVSCQDDSKPVEGSKKNFVLAKLNDDDWKGTIEMRLDNVTDTLTILGISGQPNDEVIVMKIKFNGTGLYPLTGNRGYYYSTVGGDVIVSEYELDPNTPGQVEISKYDRTEGFLEGDFEMILKKKRSNPENNIDILNFTGANFKGQIYN